MSKKKTKNKAKKVVEKKEDVVLEEVGFMKKNKKALLFGGAGFGVLALLVGGYFGAKLMMNGLAFPNSSIAGIDVGLMSKEEIREEMKKKLFVLAEQPIRVSDGQTESEFSYVDMNVFAEVNKTMDQISFVGDGSSDFELIQSFFGGEEVLMEVDFQHDRVQALLADAFGLEQRRAKNASLSLDEEGQFIVVKEKPGLKLDYEKFVADLSYQLCRLQEGNVELAFVPEKPTVMAAELEKQKELLEKRVNQVMKLKHNKEKWEIPLRDRLNWISFEKKDAHRVEACVDPVLAIDFDIKLDEQSVREYLAQEVAEKVEKAVENVKISVTPEGGYNFEGRPHNGQALEYDKAVVVMTEAINKGETEVDLPTVEIKAGVETSEELKELGIKKLLATGYTTYYGSPRNRMHNIAVGIQRYDGLLVKPGDSVSFNSHLGPVDARAGFKPELVIKGDETIPEYGGGLCQVSTTFYRAALYAGLPIEKRDPHSYAVSYYAQVGGHGLDATIYPDAGKDVIFKNDSPGHILIQSYTDGAQAYFHFYGTDDGRTVEMEGPYLSNYHGPGPTKIEETDSLPPGVRKQVERAHTGFNATWYRTIKKDSEEMKETIQSNYRAVQAKVLVGREAGE